MMGLIKAKKKDATVGAEVGSSKKKFFSLKRANHNSSKQHQQQHQQQQHHRHKGEEENKQQNRHPIPSRQHQRQVCCNANAGFFGVADQQRHAHKETLNGEDDEEEDLGGIPRSISTPSRDCDNPLPPLPHTPNDDNGGEVAKERGAAATEENDQDSIGSPCDAMMFKNRQQQKNNYSDNEEDAEAEIQLAAHVTSLQSLTLEPPTLAHLHHYISALSCKISPDPSGDLPARALRCLFSLSEHSSDKQHRIDMVKCTALTISKSKDFVNVKEDGAGVDTGKEEVDVSSPIRPTMSASSLVPALLSFLKRCPRDSSEQYLTLLVLNNISIPQANKRPIAVEYGGAKTLARLLCEDPGCHLLVIIIVNLAFDNGDGGGIGGNLNRELLTLGSLLGNENGSRNDSISAEEKRFVSCGGDVQLVDSLGYALLLAILTTEQLTTIGPIPLTSPEGMFHTPRKLLSLLLSLLESKLGLQCWDTTSGFVSPAMLNGCKDSIAKLPLVLGGDNCQFPETARWCLGALKNLTRPGKLAPSIIGVDEELAILTNKDSSASATQAILDAGILPPLLCILKYREISNPNYLTSSSCTLYGWQANSAQDAALYTLMHMSSVPGLQRVLREDYCCVEVLSSILNCGKVISNKLLKAGLRTLTGGSGGDGGCKDERIELCCFSLQCLKARLALSYLVLSSDRTNGVRSKYGSVTILADHEVPTLIELLSHCIEGRAKEGPGGYSAATFTLKGVLRGIRCILNEPKNRELVADSSIRYNGSRLNSLLLKSVACFSLMDVSSIMDSEAVEHAVVSMYQMSLYSLDVKEIGYINPFGGGGVFLPATFGDNGVKLQGKSVVSKVLLSLLNKDGVSLKGRHLANQILFRVNFLQFEGLEEDLPYAEKAFPTKSDFALDDKVLNAVKTILSGELRRKGCKPRQYIFKRRIARYEKEGVGMNVFSKADIVPGVSRSQTFSCALFAAEELAWEGVNEEHQREPSLDAIAIANNIAYYADGLDVYYGHIWKWEDGSGDLIERVYSAAETEDQMLSPEEKVNDKTERSEPYSPPRKGFLGRLKIPDRGFSDDSEPFSMFGVRCEALMCGRGSVV